AFALDFGRYFVETGPKIRSITLPLLALGICPQLHLLGRDGVQLRPDYTRQLLQDARDVACFPRSTLLQILRQTVSQIAHAGLERAGQGFTNPRPDLLELTPDSLGRRLIARRGERSLDFTHVQAR